MAPHRNNALQLEEAPPSSGPPTKRSARFVAARPVASFVDDDPASSEGYMPVLERSDVIQAVKRREPDPMELMDEDLELLFDDDVVEVMAPDTERTPRVDSTPPGSKIPSTKPDAFCADEEEPPPTLRSPL